MIRPNPDESARLKYEWDVMKTDPKMSTPLSMDANLPPTYLIHGLLDTSVLLEESIRTYDQLCELEVPVELLLVEGEGHCFEWKREEESGIKSILDKAAHFVGEYLG